MRIWNGRTLRRRTTEEVLLQGLQQLVAHERPDLLVTAVLFEDADVVLERSVRRVERVLELVALEAVVVSARLVARAVLRTDGSTDSPQRTRLAFDPDDDPFFRSRVVDADQDAFGKPDGGWLTPYRPRTNTHPLTIPT